MIKVIRSIIDGGAADPPALSWVTPGAPPSDQDQAVIDPETIGPAAVQGHSLIDVVDHVRGAGVDVAPGALDRVAGLHAVPAGRLEQQVDRLDGPLRAAHLVPARPQAKLDGDPLVAVRVVGQLTQVAVELEDGRVDLARPAGHRDRRELITGPL